MDELAGAPPAGAPPAGSHPVPSTLRLAVLALENADLLNQRSLTWSEASSRAQMFLTVLTGAVVALALVAQATDFGDGLVLFALLLLPVVLFVGLSTMARLAELNNDDIRWVQGLARLRHAWLELDPGLERYFVQSPHDDEPGVLSAYVPAGVTISRLHGLYTVPALLGVINAVIAAILVAIVVLRLGFAAGPAIVAGVLTFMLVFVLASAYGYRSFDTMRRGLAPRFPTPGPREE